ncbi:MAG: hypothetical protein CML17_06980 [Pusillimonas sp.]|nr:hypothetical protein [Pusillimonas sp.]
MTLLHQPERVISDPFRLNCKKRDVRCDDHNRKLSCSTDHVSRKLSQRLEHRDGRALMFKTLAAPLRIPIAWKSQHYARAGESLTSLGL